MKVVPFDKLACPIDGEVLSSNSAVWTCANGHSFDIAKKGYTNLLPVQQKRSFDPGDHKEMVACRQRFLNAGYFQPLADAVNRTVLANCQPGSQFSCLDAGCGEGYYLRQLAASNSGSTLALLGLDISKCIVSEFTANDFVIKSKDYSINLLSLKSCLLSSV